MGSTIQGRYHAVLMDFGSARPAPVEIRNRTEALTLQEDAEVRHRRASAGLPLWPWASLGQRCSLTLAPAQAALTCSSLHPAVQAHCTAPYKAPELYDVPSQCTIDQRIDIWSLGCVLYFMMYGVSPFEHQMMEAGGSLALAVIK